MRVHSLRSGAVTPQDQIPECRVGRRPNAVTCVCLSTSTRRERHSFRIGTNHHTVLAVGYDYFNHDTGDTIRLELQGVHYEDTKNSDEEVKTTRKQGRTTRQQSKHSSKATTT